MLVRGLWKHRPSSFTRKDGNSNMGECSDIFKSEELKALERIARNRAKAMSNGPSTDAIDRANYEKCLEDVKAEYVLYNGRVVR